MINVGVIGAGRIGRIHSKSIQGSIEGVQIKTVADVFKDSAKKASEEYNIPNYTDDYKEILNDPEIDAVIICSSTDTHSQISIEAAEKGKHIFCEKPIDYDVEKIKKTLSAVKKAGVKYQVGFNRRFDHNFNKLRELIQDGQIGDPHIIKITSRDPQAPPIEYVKVSGGMFLDMTIHDFDMATFLSGSKITEVYTQGACMINPEIGKAGDVDTAIISLKFENGSIGVIDNSREASYGYDQRIEVFGSKGYVKADNDTNTTVTIASEDGIIAEKPKYFFLERYMDSYINEMTQFFNCIKEDKEVPASGVDGLRAVLVGLAATKSLKEGRPVKIEE
ncbi:inositol 2-dehydrogenase [Clostridium uliginosum]|uniref:Myo-inositol 2-dehydrogenase / D-chiro-inositol 1-dehydrogenase n=1 Tax=Clostridium uliginosum TaxID=119641 RepID=A0A1I1N7B8_9CLOT|nr:inositol 2-dehydrogenase [Clostridium uliginosum]SFC91368.1 myo-inositol 2-dehydrogenase / D-chiro-inositol 1-dehydrogenase [Clostridium uliginosum]